jgi:hypothetical protein
VCSLSLRFFAKKMQGLLGWLLILGQPNHGKLKLGLPKLEKKNLGAQLAECPNNIRRHLFSLLQYKKFIENLPKFWP